MTIIDEYEDIFEKNVYDEKGKYFDLINKSYKISGNIFAHFLRTNISKHVKNKYTVSVINSYIKGSNIEWDLLILKECSDDEKNYNIYLPQNIICALEFKTSGAIYAKNPVASKKYINKYIRELNRVNKKYNSNIKYGYISLCEIPANLEAMKNNYPDNCFWIVEGYYGSRKKNKVNDIDDLNCFLDKLIK